MPGTSPVLHTDLYSLQTNNWQPRTSWVRADGNNWVKRRIRDCKSGPLRYSAYTTTGLLLASPVSVRLGNYSLANYIISSTSQHWGKNQLNKFTFTRHNIHIVRSDIINWLIRFSISQSCSVSRLPSVSLLLIKSTKPASDSSGLLIKFSTRRRLSV